MASFCVVHSAELHFTFREHHPSDGVGNQGVADLLAHVEAADDEFNEDETALSESLMEEHFDERRLLVGRRTELSAQKAKARRERNNER